MVVLTPLLLSSASKICLICGEDRPLEDFYRASRNKDGRQSYCKPCDNGRRLRDPKRAEQAARWYADNRDKKQAQNRAWREANLERSRLTAQKWQKTHVEHSRQWRTDYYNKNKIRRRAATRAWAEANREHTLAYAREWKRLNRDKAKIWEARRRARLRLAVSVPFTAAELAQRWSYYGGRCWMCRGPAQVSDHVKPLSKGGAHMLCNLRPACWDCNTAKSNIWPWPL